MKDSLCCCVCLKDEPFDNNPIVSCDGKNCTTVVHKACYGIQQIPDGAWFCQKCISQERTARVRCELCPSREGALKHTNKGGWCHIVCALFVPGAEFLDSVRLETVSLDKVPTDKLNKVCSICEKNNRLDRASIGACIQCIKSGCKVMFHVTCGQSQGLLTEVVSAKEGVRYVAYCCLHKQKSKRQDFTIRLSNSNICPTIHDKNKPRQSPPQLEKSDEDCVTPQESTSSIVCRSNSNRNLNISSSSSNINISSDSMSQDDSSAPELCTNSEFRDGNEMPKNIRDSNIPVKCQPIKSTEDEEATEKLQPPNIASSEMQSKPSENLLPPNIISSEVACQSLTKEEATVKTNQFSSSSTSSSMVTSKSHISAVRCTKRQSATLASDIPQKKEKVIKSELKCKSNTSSAESPVKLEKVKKTKKASVAVKKIENRVPKKSMAPSLPKSIFNHMNSMISGSPSSTTSVSIPSTSSIANTPKMGGMSCQSMEELLEWQWDQAGTLLMQQAEASDIASLLSCLHDLKNENEQLLAKQLKLSHRRDHLRATNAKLQLQLMTKPVETVTKPVTASAANPPVNDIRIMTPQTLTRSIQKAPTVDQSQVQYKHETGRSRTISESNTVFIQQQQQQQQQQQPMSIWTQSSSQQQQGQQRVDQSLNQQTIALLKHYQQQQQQQSLSTPISQTMSSGVSVSNLFSQTDLVAILNNQLHSQLSGCSQPTSIIASNQSKSMTQDVHISPNNGTNMEYLYQALQQKTQQQQQQQQQKYQQQTALTSNIYYQAASKIPTQSGTGLNFDSSQNQDKGVIYRLQLNNQSGRHQIIRPSDSFDQAPSTDKREQ